MSSPFQPIKQGDLLTLRLRDQLDAAMADRLAAEMQEIIREGEHRVVLDLSDVAYISSAGIRFLLKTYQALRKLGGSFGVAHPSPAVKSVLELSNMTLLLQGEGVLPPAASFHPAVPAARARRVGAMRYDIYHPAPGATLACSLLGDPARLEQADFDSAAGGVVAVEKDLMALGLGRFQQEGADSHASFGEFLAVAGTAACLPADSGNVPDYMLTAGSLIPRIRALYAVQCQGRWAHCVRFEAEDKEARESLSGLIRAGLDITEAPAMGVVMLAESAGLIGAALKRAPLKSGARESVFTHPGIRNWLNFTPERIHDRCLVLMTGIALKAVDRDLAPFVRPLGPDALPTGHIHAAVFSYKALPKGPLVLDETLLSLYEDEKLLTLMHLLNDHREIVGGGESLFVRGAMWLGPIAAGRK